MSRSRAFMGAGELDRRVTIERKVSTQDGTYGSELVSWSALATVWANVQDALPSRSEAVTQGLTVARNQTRIRFRYRSDVDSSMRVKVHGDGADIVMQIIAGPASIAGRKQLTEIVCERISS